MVVKTRKGVIVILCVTIILLSCGFVFLAMKLNESLSKEEVFDVSFSDVKQLSSIKGGALAPNGKLKISSLGKVIDMDFNLFNEYDEIQYEIKITNNGSIPASIVDLMISPEYSDNSKTLKVSLSDISGKIIDPGEEISAKLSVSYTSSNNPVINGVQQKSIGEKSLKGQIGLLTESITNQQEVV